MTPIDNPVITPHSHVPVSRSAQGIVDALSLKIGRPVLLDDPFLSPLAYSTGQSIDVVRGDSILSRGPSPAVRSLLSSLSIADARDLLRIDPEPSLGMARRVCLPLRRDEELLGYIWVLDPGNDLAAADLDQIRNAGGDITAILDASYRGSEADQADLIERLRDPDVPTREGAAAEAVERGLLTAEDVILCVVAARIPSAEPGRAVREAVRRLSVGHAIGTSTRGGGVLIASVGDPVLTTLSSDGFGYWLHRTLGDAVAVGQSGRLRMTELDEGSRRARVALKVARGVNRGPAVASWETLGADRIVAQLPPAVVLDTPEPLAQMLREEPELTETLTVFLEEGGHIKVAAERLSLHRSGLYYRLARIEELTGLRLSRGDDRLLAHLAIRLARASV